MLSDAEVEQSTYVCDGEDGMLTCSVVTKPRTAVSFAALALLLAAGRRRRRV